jgi:hypothetical protein
LESGAAFLSSRRREAFAQGKLLNRKNETILLCEIKSSGATEEKLQLGTFVRQRWRVAENSFLQRTIGLAMFL